MAEIIFSFLVVGFIINFPNAAIVIGAIILGGLILVGGLYLIMGALNFVVVEPCKALYALITKNDSMIENKLKKLNISTKWIYIGIIGILLAIVMFVAISAFPSLN